MKAIVCVKQVPDTQGKVAVKADGTMDRSAMATITNLIGYGPKCLIAPRRHQAGRRPDKAGRPAAPSRRQGRGTAKTRKFR